MVSVYVFVTYIRGLRPGQPLRGAGRGAPTFYTCSLGPNGALSGPDGGAQGTIGGPNRPGQRTQDLQGRLTVSEGHRYPQLINNMGYIKVPKSLHSSIFKFPKFAKL